QPGGPAEAGEQPGGQALPGRARPAGPPPAEVAPAGPWPGQGGPRPAGRDVRQEKVRHLARRLTDRTPYRTHEPNGTSDDPRRPARRRVVGDFAFTYP